MEQATPPGLSSGRLPRPRGGLRLPYQVDRDQRAHHHLAGRQYLSRRRRRGLVGEPPVLHRAGARPRHGRAGGAVPPPVRQQRQGRLTTSASSCAPAITGRPALKAGGPSRVRIVRFAQAGNVGVGSRTEPSLTPATSATGGRAALTTSVTRRRGPFTGRWLRSRGGHMLLEVPLVVLARRGRTRTPG